MTEQDLIKFKELSMQDGRLNLSWFADYVAQTERQECAKLAAEYPGCEITRAKIAENILARSES